MLDIIEQLKEPANVHDSSSKTLSDEMIFDENIFQTRPVETNQTKMLKVEMVEHVIINETDEVTYWLKFSIMIS